MVKSFYLLLAAATIVSSCADRGDDMMVIGVRNGYPFEVAGINSGDIITSINKVDIKNFDDLKKAYDAYVKSPKRTLVEIQRAGAISYHVIEP